MVPCEAGQAHLAPQSFPSSPLGLCRAFVWFTELRFSNKSGRRMVLGRTGWERPSRIAELGLLLLPTSHNDFSLKCTKRCLKTSRVPSTTLRSSGRDLLIHSWTVQMPSWASSTCPL